MKPNLSIYFHFPFCQKKCNYCDFYSTATTEKEIYDYIDALSLELDFYREKIESSNIETIYCGGGTPSILSVEQWHYFYEKVILKLDIVRGTEFTIECNPESFTAEKAKAWHSFGVNRLSIGVQSFDDRELEVMGRIHNSQKAISVLDSEALSLFKSVSADLIFATPTQTLSTLRSSLETLFSFDLLTHFSIYELTLSKNTDFYRNKNRLKFPKESIVIDMNKLITEYSEKFGFRQYEISNFAKLGYESKHNGNYWNYTDYLGLGASAHSLSFPNRYSNILDYKRYMLLVKSGEKATTFSEVVSGESLVFELLFLGLRTKRGIDIIAFEDMTNTKFYTDARSETIKALISNKLLIQKNDFLLPTKKGLLFADAIVQKLV